MTISLMPFFRCPPVWISMSELLASSCSSLGLRSVPLSAIRLRAGAEMMPARRRGLSRSSKESRSAGAAFAFGSAVAGAVVKARLGIEGRAGGVAVSSHRRTGASTPSGAEAVICQRASTNCSAVKRFGRGPRKVKGRSDSSRERVTSRAR